jgi:hypothetical protein
VFLTTAKTTSAPSITPALARAGWDEAQIRRQYLAALDRAETSRARLLDAELHAALQDREAA